MSVRKTVVRRGTLEHVSRNVELGLRFYSEEGKRPACPNQLAQFAISHTCGEERIFLVAGTPAAAILCGVVVPHYLTSEPAAFKTAWYALPGSRGYGVHLLRAFEAWAKDKGARRLFVAGRQERTLALLGCLGYAPLETVYSKDIPWQKQPYLSS